MNELREPPLSPPSEETETERDVGEVVDEEDKEKGDEDREAPVQGKAINGDGGEETGGTVTKKGARKSGKGGGRRKGKGTGRRHRANGGVVINDLGGIELNMGAGDAREPEEAEAAGGDRETGFFDHGIDAGSDPVVAVVYSVTAATKEEREVCIHAQGGSAERRWVCSG